MNLPSSCPFSPLPHRPADLHREGPTPVGVDGQLAACHFHERLIGAQPVDLFPPTTIDEELVASYEVAGQDDAAPEETT